MRRRSFARLVTILPAVAFICAAVPAFAQPPSTAGAMRGEPVVPEKVGKEIQALLRRRDPAADRRPAGRRDLADGAGHRRHGPERSRTTCSRRPSARWSRSLTTIARSTSAVINYMKDPSKITTALGRRDTFPRSDSIKITFDPRHDHLTAYTFDSNPHGVQGDMTWFDDTRSSTDYDAVWDVRTQIDAGRVDRGIPHSVFAAALHDHAGRSGGLGLQRPPRHRLQRGDDPLGRRRREARRDLSRASATSRSRQPPAPPRRFEVQPFALARQEHTTDDRLRSGTVRRPRLPHGAGHRDDAVGGDQSRTSARSNRIRRCST